MEDVVIIGAGPSGLFAAGELARHGVRARLLEHARQPHRESRATAIQPALIETLARAGVAEALGGSRHHLILFGEPPATFAGFAARWAGIVELVDGGALLVRPDGFIGFRAAPADADGLAALDRHLARYLIPASGAREEAIRAGAV
jgi:glycine/D-amino acid oxidase-like deaminating enzyme